MRGMPLNGAGLGGARTRMPVGRMGRLRLPVSIPRGGVLTMGSRCSSSSSSPLK